MKNLEEQLLEVMRGIVCELVYFHKKCHGSPQGAGPSPDDLKKRQVEADSRCLELSKEMSGLP
jgi:hypothetical protein